MFVELEKEANTEYESSFQLPTSEVKYCIYMIKKYGEDYKVSFDFSIVLSLIGLSIVAFYAYSFLRGYKISFKSKS